jgi:AraC-like DNA-binding protein
MEAEVSVPVTRTSFATASADESWDVVGKLYTRCRPSAGSDALRLIAASWEAPDLSLDTMRMPGSARASGDGHDQVTLVWWLRGRLDIDFHRTDELTCGPGDCLVMVPGVEFSCEFDELDMVTVRLPLAVVDQAAHELTGSEPAGLRFMSARPLTAALAQLWRSTAVLVREQLSVPHGLAVHPLVHSQLIDVVASAALTVFPNTAMTRGYVPGPGDARPGVVRRAVAYIDAHASLPITVSDIAQACGSDARALSAAFRKHLDTTPTAYLRRARLDGAHRDLRAGAPDVGPTVDEVAARWGFARPDRFARAYLTEYGCTPHDTLDS